MDFDDVDGLLDRLQIAAMLVGLAGVAFYLGLVLGAKTIAVGEPVFPAVMLPNLFWTGGQATGLFVTAYDATLSAIWVAVAVIVATVAASAYRQRQSASAEATDAE